MPLGAWIRSNFVTWLRDFSRTRGFRVNSSGVLKNVPRCTVFVCGRLIYFCTLLEADFRLDKTLARPFDVQLMSLSMA